MSKNNNTPVIIGIAFAAVIAFVIGLNYASKDEPETKSVTQGPISLKKGLVAYYPFNGNINSKEGKADYNATTENYSTDRHGMPNSAYAIVDKEQNLNNELSGYATNSFAISLWVKTNKGVSLIGEAKSGYPAQSRGHNLIIPPVHGGQVGNRVGCGLSVGTNGLMVLEHAHAHYTSVLTVRKPMLNWNHIVISWDNNQVTLYVNGAFVKTGLQSLMKVFPSSPLGGNHWGDQTQGEIDDVRFFNFSLNKSEVAHLYQSEKPKNK